MTTISLPALVWAVLGALLGLALVVAVWVWVVRRVAEDMDRYANESDGEWLS